jgi:hypothetical protein
MNDRWDDAVPNKPQRAVEDARDETRRRHRRIARDDPQERSDTRAIPRIRAVSRQACGWKKATWIFLTAKKFRKVPQHEHELTPSLRARVDTVLCGARRKRTPWRW